MDFACHLLGGGFDHDKQALFSRFEQIKGFYRLKKVIGGRII